MVITPQRSITLLGIRLNWWRPSKVKVMFDGVNWGGTLFLSNCSRESFWSLVSLPFCSGCPFLVSLLFWEVIITVWEAARILSSSVEYLSACLYSSSIVTSGSSDSDWKKGVVGPKLLQKFWRTALMLYASICWIVCPNLLVKSRIDSSSRLKMVYSELMFPFSGLNKSIGK